MLERSKSFAANLGPWLVEGVRAATGRWPRWDRLRTTPAILATLLALDIAIVIATQRLEVGGPAEFVWAGLARGWMGTAVLTWLAWWLSRWPRTRAAAVGPARMITMVYAMSLPIGLVAGTTVAWILRDWPGGRGAPGGMLVLAYALWAASLGLFARLFGQAARGERGKRALASFGVVAVMLALAILQPEPHPWWRALPAATRDHAAHEAATPFRLTQSMTETQARLAKDQAHLVPQPASCRSACSYTSTGCPPWIRCRSFTITEGTAWMPLDV